VPIAQIVIVSVQSDTDYLRRAMLAGARDFLSKPPPADELINTIRRLGQMSQQREALAAAHPAGGGPGHAGVRGVGGKVISVFSPKGGAGCTTLLTNLALALQHGDNKVVLVDANLQFGDVGVFLNLQGKYSLVSLAERADEIEEDFIQSVVVPHSSGVKVLLGPPTPEDAELVGAAQLKKVIDALREHFNFVLVDTAPILRDVELSVFDISDRVVLVATPDIPSLANIKKFFDLIEKLEYSSDKMLLVLNRVDRRGGITAANVEETLKHAVRGQILLDDKTVLASINSGVPFITGPKSLPPVQGILDLAARLREELEPKEPAAAIDDRGRKQPARAPSLFQRR
jgi:pilus assembly protein CpaE